MPEVLKNPLDY